MEGIKHYWNGTILTVVSDSGISSCDLKGAKGDDGARGAQGAAGGAINDVSLIDKSLEIENYAADAKTVGDKFKAINSTITAEISKGFADINSNNSIITNATGSNTILVQDSGNAPLAGLNVYGKTRKCANLIPYPYYANGTHTLNGVTWTVNADGSVTANGTATANSIFVISNYKTPVSAGTYTLSGIPVNGSATTFMIQTANRNGFAKNNTNASGDVFTLATETSLLIQLVVFNGYTANNLVFKPMLNEGTTALPYEPYFEGLKSAGDSGSIDISLKGVNLIPYPYNETTKTLNGITFTDNGDGTITANGTATEQAYFVLLRAVFPIGNYFLQGSPKDGLTTTVLYFTNNDYSLYKADTGSGVAINVTKQENITIAISISKDTTVNNLVFKPMLNEGTTALPYEPYREPQTMVLLTENGLHGIPVASGGNYTDDSGQAWLCDEIDLEKGVKISRVGCVDMGALYWSSSKTASGGVRFYVNLAKKPLYVNASNVPNIMCSRYSAVSTSNTWNDINGATINDTALEVKDSNYTDATTFKAAMQGVMLVYELATPTETALTAAEIEAYRALHTNKPNTTFTIGDLANLKVDYVADAKSYIDNKFNELAKAILV